MVTQFLSEPSLWQNSKRDPSRQVVDKYNAFSYDRWGLSVSLVMKANGGWAKRAQKCLHKVTLRYATKKGLAADDAVTYLAATICYVSLANGCGFYPEKY